MKNLKNKLILSFTLFLLGCGSLPSIKNAPQIKDFEALNRGQNKEAVKKLLGYASEIRSIKRNDQSHEAWIYNDSNNTQRGAVVFNQNNQVETVTTMPLETEKESNLDFLIKEKFTALQFEKIPLQRCQRDFVPAEVFYIDPKQGMIIEVDKPTGIVNSLSRNSPEYAADLIRRIKSCKR